MATSDYIDGLDLESISPDADEIVKQCRTVEERIDRLQELACEQVARMRRADEQYTAAQRSYR